jgi:hypothetical protein
MDLVYSKGGLLGPKCEQAKLLQKIGSSFLKPLPIFDLKWHQKFELKTCFKALLFNLSTGQFFS